MFRFQYETGFEKSFYYRDFKSFIMSKVLLHSDCVLHYDRDSDFWIFSWIQSEMFCFTAVFIACSLCSYECTDSKLETPHEQATITAFIQNILLQR